MFEELSKYSVNGRFLFFPDNNLKNVCNAPSDKAGIYLVYDMGVQPFTLIYIGQSGKVKKDGKIFIRKGGIKDRLVNGKTNRTPRKKYWTHLMKQQNIVSIEVNGMLLLMRRTLIVL